MTIRRSNIFLLALLGLGGLAPLALAVPRQVSPIVAGPSLLKAPPVGSIVAWYPALVGTPALPSEWAPCDGQPVSDPRSPYAGQFLPNLNGEARYLRGGVVSGTMQDDATAVNGLSASTGIAGNHFHTMGSAGLHSHSRTDVGGVGSTRGFAAASNQSGATSTSADGLHTHSIDSTGNHTHPVSLTGENETRPITMTVVWIMRIK
jgi:hypothetical protein